MKIINLIEDTKGREECVAAHGLSFYVETKKHKLLLDLGPSSQTIENAKALGIDLKEIDTVVLSHGHYDHSGGIIPFTRINDKAKVYFQESAKEDYYADDGLEAKERYRYIGIDKAIVSLPQANILNGDAKIDDDIEVFTIKERSHKLPSSNKNLLIKKGDCFERDDFGHEHFLVVREEGKSVLLSGCAHNGILSILDAYIEKFRQAPDLVVSGFHLMKKTEYNESEIEEIKYIAEELKKYTSGFVTCHCTGIPAYEIMKPVLGDRLEYVHAG
ncbi:MAG: MBL fold metallo-hydrolase, partial [Lachnospiraceae bacterium]|nr:MBL fold metallo-hydrolase [Lachnospiraceae bacterium]